MREAVMYAHGECDPALLIVQLSTPLSFFQNQASRLVGAAMDRRRNRIECEGDTSRFSEGYLIDSERLAPGHFP